MKNADVVSQVKSLGAPPLVEVTGGELASGLTVLVETSGAIDARLVPPPSTKSWT